MSEALKLDGDGFLMPRAFRAPAIEATDLSGWPGKPAHEAICFFWHEMALYLGPSLPSAPHNQFCLELTLALDGELEVSLASGSRLDKLGGVLVGSNVPHRHRLRGSRVAQLVVGPLTTAGLALRASLEDRPVGLIRHSQVEPFRDLLALLIGCDEISVAHTVACSLVDHFSRRSKAPPADGRIQLAMNRLLGDFSKNTPVATLACEAGLSESRFCHLFRAGVGVPVRTYRRWLRLRAAIVYGLSGWDLSAAAHEAGFCDHSEFSRTCRAAFGAPPSAITRHPTSVLLGEAPSACALMRSIVRPAAGRWV